MQPLSPPVLRYAGCTSNYASFRADERHASGRQPEPESHARSARSRIYRHHSRSADRADAALRRCTAGSARARRNDDPDRNGRHAFHSDQLRSHGSRLPERRVGLHVRGAGDPPALGFATGWSMLMDYVLNPLICTVWCAKAAMNILPAVPEVAWIFFFVALSRT